ncbi:MAG: hypothetical protein HQL30_04470 [Candidatus Omnitrophica bacterium]|nr:hypothetical protein [Candidatus Omnitrophota bacterium]
MNIKKILASITILCFTITSACPPAFSEDEATEKVSKELIKQFTNFVDDVAELNSLPTDKAKVAYILKKGKERVWEESSDRLKEAAKEKLEEYVKKKLREELFKAQIPDMMHKAIIEGKNVGALWSAADIDINAKLDTQVNAFKAGLEGVQMTYNFISSWKKDGPEEALRSLGKDVGEKIITYFVPGWGWYKLAQSMVEALGKYVVQYAFSSALEGKMKVVLAGHDPQQNPRGFVEWIQTVDIASYVQREWDEQLAYGGWYLKGKNNEGDNMKNAIIAELSRMKADILEKKQIENELRSKLDALVQETRGASAGVTAAVDAARKEADPALKMIDEFDILINGAKKQDAETFVRTEESDEDKYNGRMAKYVQSFPYEGFDHGSILSALETAFTEIKESGIEGYDTAAIERMYEDYVSKRKAALQAASKKMDDGKRKANEILAALAAQYDPQFAAIWARIQNARNRAEHDALVAQSNALSDVYNAARGPYMNRAWGSIVEGQFYNDYKVLCAEEQVIVAEALERGSKMRAYMREKAEKIREELDKAVEAYRKAGSETSQEALTKLNFPDGWGSAYFYTIISENMAAREGLVYEMPGDASRELVEVQQMKVDLSGDRSAAAELYAKEKKAFEQYAASAISIAKSFESSMPKRLLIPYDGKQSWGFENIVSTSQFYNAQLGGEILPAESVGIPRVWGGDNDAEAQAKVMERKDILEEMDKAIAAVAKRESDLFTIEHADQVASAYARIYYDITLDMFMLRLSDLTLEQEIRRQSDMYIMPDNSAFMYTLPEKMRGYAYLEQMKEAWAKYSDLVSKLDNLRKGIGTNIRYRFDFAQSYYPPLDKWLTIPDRIKVYQETYETVKKTFDERAALADKYLGEAKQKFDDIKKNSYNVQEKIKQLEKFQKENVSHFVRLYSMFAKTDAIEKSLGGWMALEKEVEDELKKSGQDKIDEEKRWERERQAAEEEAARKKKEEEERKKKEAEDEAGRQAIQVLSATLNKYNAASMPQTVVLSKMDLKNGKIEVAGKLSTVAGSRGVEISVDGGRSWTKIQNSADVKYSFAPTPDAEYTFILRIDMGEAGEVTQELFPYVQSITYKDIDFVKLVQDSIMAIANAYEQQNVSAFSEYVSDDFLGNRTFLEEGVRFDFDMFSSIRLAIFINRIEKGGAYFIADTKWNKTQSPRKTGQEQKTSGNTSMIFAFEDGKMKLKNLKGNLIYATLSPEIAESSGLGVTVIDEVRAARDDRDPVQPGAGTTEGDTDTETADGTSARSESGSVTLTQYGFHDCDGYTFACSAVTRDIFAFSSDFRREDVFIKVNPSGGIVDLGGVSIDSVTEAPSSGYDAGGWLDAATGHTYALQLPDGKYAIISITSMTAAAFPFTTVVRYKYQRDGSRNF